MPVIYVDKDIFAALATKALEMESIYEGKMSSNRVLRVLLKDEIRILDIEGGTPQTDVGE